MQSQFPSWWGDVERANVGTLLEIGFSERSWRRIRQNWEGLVSGVPRFPAVRSFGGWCIWWKGRRSRTRSHCVCVSLKGGVRRTDNSMLSLQGSNFNGAMFGMGTSLPSFRVMRGGFPHVVGASRQDSHGRTALCLAADWGHLPVAELLLEAGLGVGAVRFFWQWEEGGGVRGVKCEYRESKQGLRFK